MNLIGGHSGHAQWTKSILLHDATLRRRILHKTHLLLVVWSYGVISKGFLLLACEVANNICNQSRYSNRKKELKVAKYSFDDYKSGDLTPSIIVKSLRDCIYYLSINQWADDWEEN